MRREGVTHRGDATLEKNTNNVAVVVGLSVTPHPNHPNHLHPHYRLYHLFRLHQPLVMS